MNIKNIENHYILSNIDRNFAQGARAKLRYACEYLYASLMKLNPKGVDPFEYLNFAKTDISTNDLRGAINGLGNTKKAIHLTIDCFFELLGLIKAFRKSNFPTKLEVIQQLEAFPTNVIRTLNQNRNYVEHKYTTINIKEVVDFIDVTEMFLRMCYPFLKHMVTGVRVGIKEDKRDIFWILDPKKSQISIYENLNSKSFNSLIGVIYYDDLDNKTKRNLLQTISIKKSNLSDWLPYLNTFIYCTKKETIPTNPPYDPKHDERLMLFQSKKIFF